MCTFITQNLQMIRKYICLSRRAAYIQSQLIPETSKNKYLAIRKTKKQVHRKKKLALEYEGKMLFQARSALRH